MDLETKVPENVSFFKHPFPKPEISLIGKYLFSREKLVSPDLWREWVFDRLIGFFQEKMPKLLRILLPRHAICKDFPLTDLSQGKYLRP